MIETFQAITLFGTGDPKLMADGISQALVNYAWSNYSCTLFMHNQLDTEVEIIKLLKSKQLVELLQTNNT